MVARAERPFVLVPRGPVTRPLSGSESLAIGPTLAKPQLCKKMISLMIMKWELVAFNGKSSFLTHGPLCFVNKSCFC